MLRGFKDGLSICKICESTSEKPVNDLTYMPVHEVASLHVCSLQAASSIQHPAARYCVSSNIKTHHHLLSAPVPVFASTSNSHPVPLPVQIVRCSFFLFHFLISPFARTDPEHRDDIGAPILLAAQAQSSDALPCHQLLPASAQSSNHQTTARWHSKHSKAKQAAQHSTTCILRTVGRQPAHKPPWSTPPPPL